MFCLALNVLGRMSTKHDLANVLCYAVFFVADPHSSLDMSTMRIKNGKKLERKNETSGSEKDSKYHKSLIFSFYLIYLSLIFALYPKAQITKAELTVARKRIAVKVSRLFPLKLFEKNVSV